ncbi:ABC-type transporter MlaC component [Dongia mobilis]|uniref:ABC-type transporter MlaC component n=1 Tax=Dongia mobilis TaxID=578943 RepID=A0A4R6WD16_9PROT|nr:ABC transporter substrate-binding protein [Dongia mobilis]TDQ77537.1 ABC-type transporter MlaC component [Dongia mobilis]
MRGILTILSLVLFLSPLSGAVAARADAASYIRHLFDATISAPDGAEACSYFTPLGRFAAGQHWRGFDAGARAAFAGGFCELAAVALTRLRRLYPDLALSVIDTHVQPSRNDGPRMAWVRSSVRAGGKDWPVDWQVADPSGAAHLADMKVLGVSLAIMLRGLAARVPANAPADILRPWQRALDLALPDRHP